MPLAASLLKNLWKGPTTLEIKTDCLAAIGLFLFLNIPVNTMETPDLLNLHFFGITENDRILTLQN